MISGEGKPVLPSSSSMMGKMPTYINDEMMNIIDYLERQRYVWDCMYAIDLHRCVNPRRPLIG